MKDEPIAVRLLKEKLDLHGNMVRLNKFLEEPENTRELESKEIELLCDQQKAMHEYYRCLNIRSYYHANDRTWPQNVG